MLVDLPDDGRPIIEPRSGRGKAAGVAEVRACCDQCSGHPRRLEHHR
jgi:hypothetical protein